MDISKYFGLFIALKFYIELEITIYRYLYDFN